ncbi:hypothetical protein [Salinibacter ruber]|nr:hypothetical protein [Salinibacter ruber]
MLNSIQNAWNSTKNFLTPDDQEEFRRTVRRYSAHATFLGSTLFGAGAGLALRDALQSKGSENVILGQLDAATEGLSDDTVEGLCLAAGITGGTAAGKKLHGIMRPKEQVEIDLPYVQDEVDSEEAQRILRREQRKTRLAMEQIADAVGVEDVDELGSGYEPIQSLENAIMSRIGDLREIPELWDIRSRALDESVARSIIVSVQGLENARPSLVRAIIQNESRDQVIEAAEETIAALQEDEEDQTSDAAENGEADEPAEAAQA